MPYKNKNVQQEYQRKRYKQNKDKYRESLKKRRLERAKFIFELKKKYVCSKCGESHPFCLEFHHRDPETKTMTICKMVRSCCAYHIILKEIEKCDILCSNCHRKLHFDANSFNLGILRPEE